MIGDSIIKSLDDYEFKKASDRFTLNHERLSSDDISRILGKVDEMLSGHYFRDADVVPLISILVVAETGQAEEIMIKQLGNCDDWVQQVALKGLEKFESRNCFRQIACCRLRTDEKTRKKMDEYLEKYATVGDLLEIIRGGGFEEMLSAADLLAKREEKNPGTLDVETVKKEIGKAQRDQSIAIECYLRIVRKMEKSRKKMSVPKSGGVKRKMFRVALHVR